MPQNPKAPWTATPYDSAMFYACDFGCFSAEIVSDRDGATIVEPHFLTAQEPEDGHPDKETAMLIVEDAARQIALKTLLVLDEVQLYPSTDNMAKYRYNFFDDILSESNLARSKL
jgi:hypothetical protein